MFPTTLYRKQAARLCAPPETRPRRHRRRWFLLLACTFLIPIDSALAALPEIALDVEEGASKTIGGASTNATETCIYYEDFEAWSTADCPLDAGWRPVDLTKQRGLFWNLSTNGFLGGGDSRGWYCGSVGGAGEPCLGSPPGYPNNVDQRLTRSFVLPSAASLTLDLYHAYETELGFDFARVDVSTDGGSTFVTLTSLSGSSGGFINTGVDLTPYAGQAVVVRFRFTSDGSFSAEDGALSGGWRIGSVRISGPSLTVYEGDFESSDGGWVASVAPEVDTATFRLETNPPCFAGPASTDNQNIGECFANCRSWVAYDPETGVLPNTPDNIVAEGRGWVAGIESPPISLPSDATRYFLEFDVYGNLPFDFGASPTQLFFYDFEIVSLGSGPCILGGSSDGTIYFTHRLTAPVGTGRPGWRRFRRDITPFVQSGASQIQVRLLLMDSRVEREPAFGWSPNTTSGVYFDNVSIKAENTAAAGVACDIVRGCPATTISGIVRGTSCFENLEGLLVRLTDGEGNTSDTMTGAGGIFSFSGVASSCETGTVSLPGVSPASRELNHGGSTSVALVGPGESVEFVVDCAKVDVTGTLTSDCGDALEGVAVTLIDGEGAPATTLTGPGGAYAFLDVSSSATPGSLSISIPPGFESSASLTGVAVDLTSDRVLDFTLDCVYVDVTGTVSSNCSGGLAGVTVDIVAGTDVFITTTSAGGAFSFTGIRYSDAAADNISIVLPLGFRAVSPTDGAAHVVLTQDRTVVFTLACNVPTGQARSMGYWKHQTNVYISGRGSAQESQADMTSTFAEMIFSHFHENALNAIAVEGATYLPGVSGPTPLTLAAMQTTLTVNQSGTMLIRAKQQYLALLLNLASGKLASFSVVSSDGATASQAIQHVAALMNDASASNDELAKNICDTINNAQLVSAGVVPLSIPNIAYGIVRDDVVGESSIAVSPNPGSGGYYVFSLGMPKAGDARLTIYDVSGRVVAKPHEGKLAGGVSRVVWDGRVEDGSRLAPGVYFARLTAPTDEKTLKFVHMSR